MEFYRLAEEYLEEKRKKLWEEWGIDPVPDEPLRRVPVTFGVINVWVYGMNTWGDLFNSRQKLALITFTEKVRLAYKKMLEEGYDKDYAKAVVSYLGLALGRLADYSSTLTVWENNRDTIAHTYSRQALPMIWDYIEANTIGSSSGNWLSGINWILSVLSHLTQIPPVEVEE
ncbi:hypothetical protein [Thermocrinis sp.]|uniref:hypothetical protein n=1 Tax=Thermocrinis sp. TaxID=2024383 RepID=UPI003C0A1FC7